jgi:methylmalonyl-CoA mutase
MRAALNKAKRDDILIVAGGVIPPQDYDAVRAAGAVEIFPPGTVIPEAAERLMDNLLGSSPSRSGGEVPSAGRR